MSSRCNVASCSNDRRYKDRLVVMPHVTEMQFHKPREQDYDKWGKKLDRLNYKVSVNTRVCSNHFRYGKPLHTDNIPALHMRSYPSWAMSVSRVRRELESLPDDLVCEVLSQMCLYAENKEIEHILKDSLERHKHVINSVHDISSLCKNLDKSLARTLIQNALPFVPIGKCLGCLAIFTHGVEIEGMNLRKCQSSSVDVSDPSADNPAASMQSSSFNVQDIHSYCSVNTDVCPGTDHTYFVIGSSQPAVKSQNTQSRLVKPCRKSSCKKKIMSLEAKVKSLQQEVSRLKIKVRLRTCQRNEKADRINSILKQSAKPTANVNKVPKISVNMLKDSDNLIALHTGLPTFAHFRWVFDEVADVARNMTYWDGSFMTSGESSTSKKPGPARSVSLEDELLITLMKLKLNMSGDYLSFLFGLSASTVSTIISTWIPLLSLQLSGLIYWPSREEVRAFYPNCFKKWPGITAILDYFEIATERPSHVEANSQIFSSYKNRTTSKFVLACTPGGSISYISPAAGGNMSDKEMVIKCGIPEKFSPGDKCMADKGFRIEGELLERGVELITPPFVRQGKPFTVEENNNNKNIAHSRIHVERVIGRVRDYMFLNGTIPIKQLDIVSPAVKVCCALTNIKNSVVK